ncbi:MULTISPECIES: YqjD family protein [unclassified Roseovarius]|uniref:DUF883 family protein n=1 Tax=unclassified Roseovarius TaxID=2614913 RepID=UPI00273F4DCC|nr:MULTISPECIES: hypothetical protein [unclassified Roseovarius]
MAQSKSATKASASETEQLSAQIDALKDDIATISKTLVEMGSARRDAVVNDASEKVAHLKTSSEKRLQEMQGKAEEIANRTGDAVRNQPATAVGIAVGVGFLLGFLSGRK